MKTRPWCKFSVLKMKSLLFFFIVIFHLVYCQNAAEDGGESSSVEITTTEITTVEPVTGDSTTETTSIESITEDSTIESTSIEAITGDSTIESTSIETITGESTIESTTIEETSEEPTTIISTTVEDTTIETTTEEPTTPTSNLFLSDANSVLSWSPKYTENVVVEALEGYKISVNISECNIDGTNGEYATITTDEYTNGLMFTYEVSGQPTYLYNNNILLGRFVGTNASNFTVVFTRLGYELTTTTTDVPTTTIILPTPGSNDSSTLLVYLSGRSVSDYWNDTELLHELRSAIGAMAAKYCENENFPLNGSVTADNVIVNYLLRCSSGWPGSDTCIQLNFSVPVNLYEDTNSLWTGYQMTTAHMQLMWSRYAEMYLPDGTTIYTPPGNGTFKWGIAILLACTLIFGLILLGIRHYGMKVSKMMRRRKLSDTASIISASDRNSQISLPPHYLQDTPALFENAYPMYNPDRNPEYSEPSYANTFDYSNYQQMDLENQVDDENEVEESGA